MRRKTIDGAVMPIIEDRIPEVDEDEDDEDDGESGGTAMMSIFASYYGIEDKATANKSAAEMIDSPQFDPGRYVEVQTFFAPNPSLQIIQLEFRFLQDLLASQTVESLVAQDTSMIHEIRVRTRFQNVQI